MDHILNIQNHSTFQLMTLNFALECKLQKNNGKSEVKRFPLNRISTIFCMIIDHQLSQRPYGSCALEAANMILL